MCIRDRRFSFVFLGYVRLHDERLPGRFNAAAVEDDEEQLAHENLNEQDAKLSYTTYYLLTQMAE
eukprot:13831845-Alexandrium_andersonii.AAC.1